MKQENGDLFVCGNLEVSALCGGGDGIPFLVEKTVPVELKVQSGLDGEIGFLPWVSVLSTGFSILSETQLELRTELRMSGMIHGRSTLPILSDVAVQEDAPRVRDALCALRICYAEAGDRILGHRQDLFDVHGRRDEGKRLGGRGPPGPYHAADPPDRRLSGRYWNGL